MAHALTVVRKPILILAGLAFGACEDAELVAVNDKLDEAIRVEQAKSRMLLERAKAMAKVHGADPVISGAAATSEQMLRSIGVDEAKIEHAENRTLVHVAGRRGGTQIVSFLTQIGTEAQSLRLDELELERDDWKMKLSAPRVREAKIAAPKPMPIPEPSLLSFGQGDRLHARAKERQETLLHLQQVVARLEAKDTARKVTVTDETVAAGIRARRHFAMKILPFARRDAKAKLVFEGDRAKWSGGLMFESIDDAKKLLARVCDVDVYETGEHPKLEAKLTH